MAKTKIVCTIGPASGSPDILRQLIQNGLDVARLNFSHGSHAEHLEKIETIRTLSHELGKPVAVLQDLCGPKIRIGEIPEPGMRLDAGQELILTTDGIVADDNRVSVSYRHLPADVKEGDRLLLADGLMELVVKRTTDSEIYCEIITGGILTSHKGINLPTGTIKAPALTEKDKKDLLFGLKHGVDYVALSFVKSGADIMRVREIIEEQGKDTPVIAKIEKHEALDNIDDIIEAADGIMVARGDLGVEIPLENVPSIQKMLIRSANKIGKPVIIATQMLRSMVGSPRPTRAEAADVANGVLDGADAVMLSEETASGSYPVEAVRYMRRIIESAERNYPHQKYLSVMAKGDVTESVSYGACILADNIDAAAIVATSRSGLTAWQISRYRPSTKLIALSPEQNTIRRLALCWGCIPFHISLIDDTDEMIEKAADKSLHTGQVAVGDTIVITAGRPVWAKGRTNMLWVKKL